MYNNEDPKGLIIHTPANLEKALHLSQPITTPVQAHSRLAVRACISFRSLDRESGEPHESDLVHTLIAMGAEIHV